MKIDIDISTYGFKIQMKNQEVSKIGYVSISPESVGRIDRNENVVVLLYNDEGA